MGDTKKIVRRGLQAVSTGGLSEFKEGRLGDKALKGAEKPFKTGASAQQREAGREIDKQKQAEQLKLLETEDEIARKRALSGSGKAGRQSLIRSSPTGLATTLGGG